MSNPAGCGKFRLQHVSGRLDARLLALARPNRRAFHLLGSAERKADDADRARRAAEAKVADADKARQAAETNLGEISAEVKRWFEAAANAGDSNAMLEIGYFYDLRQD